MSLMLLLYLYLNQKNKKKKTTKKPRVVYANVITCPDKYVREKEFCVRAKQDKQVDLKFISACDKEDEILYDKKCYSKNFSCPEGWAQGSIEKNYGICHLPEDKVPTSYCPKGYEYDNNRCKKN